MSKESNSPIEEKVKEFNIQFPSLYRLSPGKLYSPKDGELSNVYRKHCNSLVESFLRQSLTQISQEEYKRGAREALEAVKLERKLVPVDYTYGSIPDMKELILESSKIGEMNGYNQAVSEQKEKESKFLNTIK